MDPLRDDLTSPAASPVKGWNIFLPMLFVLVLITPGYSFFTQRGGLSVLHGLNLKDFSYTIFPLIGLYAFTLVWFQIMIGSNMSFLRRLFPWIEKFHRREGVFVFLFAWTHPTLLFIGVGLTSYLSHSFLDPKLVPYIYFGYLQLFLITLTVVTALLRKTKFFQKIWYKFHILNYLTFFSIWIHSWFIGSDVHQTNLKYLWLFFIVTVLTSAIARRKRGIN